MAMEVTGTADADGLRPKKGFQYMVAPSSKTPMMPARTTLLEDSDLPEAGELCATFCVETSVAIPVVAGNVGAPSCPPASTRAVLGWPSPADPFFTSTFATKR